MAVQQSANSTSKRAPNIGVSYTGDGGPFIQPYTQEQTIEKILVIASFDPAAASTIAGILGVNSQQLRSRGVVPANSPQLDARTRNILITYFAQETLGA